MLFTRLLKTIVKRVHGVSHLFSFFNETNCLEDVHAIITVLKEAGVKSTATPAKLTVDGKVCEAFARTKLYSSTISTPYSETEMMRYMTMFITIFVTLLIMLMCDMKNKSRQSQGVSLKKFMSIQQRNQTKDVKELVLLKGLIIVDIELVTVKHHRAWVDEADKKSQCLETCCARRKTMESEREAKDQIMVQINKYTCNGGPRYQEPSEISKIDPSTDPKVEAECEDASDESDQLEPSQVWRRCC